MDVHLASKRRAAASIEAAFPGAVVVDVTSRGPQPWVRLSPFFPHGAIPVPFTPDVTSQSVEGVWQALKVFMHADVDAGRLAVTAMRGLKRTSAAYGPPLGHRRGLYGTVLLGYEHARREIYLPTYRHVLEGGAAVEVAQLRELADRGPVVLLDYTLNGDPADLRTPLSHAALLRRHLLGDWPSEH
ncbi:hypothetical protein Cme02nite_66130 [Catellatospora methionotrophica]|uniref:Uncharacterized protein n=1 Tax=Catellatospora methionotrophica TaxID=121620 RepID=A0A8J3PKA8_9ACTN|nr:hypothetical protein [Catellatospora methionotrophica]GIG18281.1 hypothetical protein Cme02nite_66130 [Catellatospora methionotrophica]